MLLNSFKAGFTPYLDYTVHPKMLRVFRPITCKTNGHNNTTKYNISEGIVNSPHTVLESGVLRMKNLLCI